VTVRLQELAFSSDLYEIRLVLTRPPFESVLSNFRRGFDESLGMSARIVEHGLLQIGDIVRRVPCAQLFVAPFEQWAAGSGSTDALADFLRIRRRPDLAHLEQVYAQVAHGARARHDQHSQQLPREYVRSLDGATECVQASVREGACKLLLLSRLDRFFARHAPSSGWLHLWRSTRGARSRDVYSE